MARVSVACEGGGGFAVAGVGVFEQGVESQ
jgi:hypothetical protein